MFQVSVFKARVVQSQQSDTGYEERRFKHVSEES